MTRPSSLPAAAHPLDGVFVLRGRALRPGTALQDTPRFRDDKWPLRAALLQRHQYSLVLNFQTVPAHYRAVAKEVCRAMLSAPLPPGETRLDVKTVHRVLAELVVFFTWLATRRPQPGRPAAPALQDLAGADLQDYQRHLTVTTRAVGARHTRRSAVRYLWRYRGALTSDRLPFDPRHLEGWGEPRHNAPADNTTDRIPEQVHGPLLGWALRFVHEFAEDILAADQQWRAHHARRRRAAVRGRDGSLRVALGRLLDDHVARGRPLPGWRGTANLGFLADRLGCNRSALVRYQAHVDSAAERVGIGEWSYFDTPISATLDGKPWLEGIATDHTASHGLAVLIRMLHVARYTTLAFLSGMRDCEIKHLRRGCLHVRHDDSGRPYRWQVTGLAFKGENDPSGVEATWTIGEPAARAVEILHRLQPPDVDLLFARLAHGPGNRRTDVNVSDALTSQGTNKQLNWFVDWINDYCDTHGRSDRVPLVNKRPWTLSTSQFRRIVSAL